MHRRAFVVIVLALLLIPSLAAAQGATPIATPGSGRPLDLGAMLLTPADLEALGLGGLRMVEHDYRDRDHGAVDKLIPFGWQRDYGVRHAVAVDPAATPLRARTAVFSYIAEYADAAGAAEGFIVVEEEDDDASAEGILAVRDIAGARNFGDQSEVTRFEQLNLDGRPFVHLDLAFQHGNLNAGVAITEYAGEEPDLATLEALAAALLTKIEAGEAGAGPGLQARALRLAGPDVTTSFDAYTRLDGETIGNYREAPEATAAAAARMEGATDSYMVTEGVTRGAESGDDAFVTTVVVRFATPEAAGAWLQGTQERLSGAPSLYTNVAPVAAPVVGDESTAFSMTVAHGDASLHGYAAYVRVGHDVAVLRIDAQPAPPLEVAEALVRAQVDCLVSEQYCPSLPVPAGLSPPATPVAAPAATPLA